eukprot:768408-Hanusia_phi.AAC.3
MTKASENMDSSLDSSSDDASFAGAESKNNPSAFVAEVADDGNRRAPVWKDTDLSFVAADNTDTARVFCKHVKMAHGERFNQCWWASDTVQDVM